MGSTIEAPYLKAYISLFSVHWPLPKGVHKTVQWGILRLQYCANYWSSLGESSSDRQLGTYNYSRTDRVQCCLCQGIFAQYPVQVGSLMTANVLRSSTFDKITQSDHLSTSPADSGMQIKHNYKLHGMLGLHWPGPSTLQKLAMGSKHIQSAAGSYDQADEKSFCS